MERYIKKVWKTLLLLLSLKGKLIPPVLFSSSAAPCSFLGFIAIETQSKGSLLLPPWDFYSWSSSFLCCFHILTSPNAFPCWAHSPDRNCSLPSTATTLTRPFPSALTPSQKSAERSHRLLGHKLEQTNLKAHPSCHSVIKGGSFIVQTYRL